jgi:ketosteroid isomerase-like protein
VTIDHRALIDRLVTNINQRDVQHLDEIFTEDVVIEWPQSGEVIRGLHNLRELIANYPSDPLLDPTTTRAHGVDEMRVVAPLFTLVRVQGGGNIGSAAVRARYPDGATWWWVRMYELRDGRIARSTEYFAQDFDAPEWRAPLVERAATTHDE